eukprot:1797680-Amphidinium_carterae.1
MTLQSPPWGLHSSKAREACERANYIATHVSIVLRSANHQWGPHAPQVQGAQSGADGRLCQARVVR